MWSWEAQLTGMVGVSNAPLRGDEEGRDYQNKGGIWLICNNLLRTASLWGSYSYCFLLRMQTCSRIHSKWMVVPRLTLCGLSRYQHSSLIISILFLFLCCFSCLRCSKAIVTCDFSQYFVIMFCFTVCAHVSHKFWVSLLQPGYWDQRYATPHLDP